MAEGRERGDYVSQLADVTDLSLGDPEHWQDGAIAESVMLILDELDRSADSISGWSSFIDDEEKKKRGESEDVQGAQGSRGQGS